MVAFSQHGRVASANGKMGESLDLGRRNARELPWSAGTLGSHPGAAWALRLGPLCRAWPGARAGIGPAGVMATMRRTRLLRVGCMSVPRRPNARTTLAPAWPAARCVVPASSTVSMPAGQSRSVARRCWLRVNRRRYRLPGRRVPSRAPRRVIATSSVLDIAEKD